MSLFELQSVVVGTLTEPTAPDATTGGGLFQVSVDVSAFTTADGYVFKVTATVGTNVMDTSQLVRIDNTGDGVAAGCCAMLFVFMTCAKSHRVSAPVGQVPSLPRPSPPPLAARSSWTTSIPASSR